MKGSWRSWLTLLEGCLLVALGVRLLQSADLLVSGTAGLSLLVSDLLPISFGIAFFVIKMVLGLRVSEEEEYEGVDVSECGMEAYPEFAGAK